MKQERQPRNRDDRDVWKGAAAGLVAGLVASWTMNQFQAAWSKVTEGFEKPHGAQSMQPTEGGPPSDGPQTDTEDQDDATVKAASAVSEGLFGHKLKPDEKRAAGALVHYAFGTATGGLYGALAEITPEVTKGVGVPFGAAFWLTADETAVPLLGLSKSATEYPISTHAYALASHLVFGFTAEIVRRTLRSSH